MKLRERPPLLWKQRGYIGIGNRRVMGSMNARRRLEALLDGSQFCAPRTSSITQTRGSGTPTITRATTAYVTNNDGYAVQVLSGELREQGARRVRNLLVGSSENLANANWTAVNITLGTGITDPNGGTAATTLTATAANGTIYNTISTLVVGNSCLSSLRIRRRTGTGKIYIRTASGGNYEVTNQVSATWGSKVVGLPVVVLATTGYFVIVIETSGDAIDVAFPQLEDVTAQTTQTAGEYVSVGVLSAPYHGAEVDGVKYFDTDISGNPIPATTLDGSVVEAAATQYLGVTGTPATQTTASLGTGTYTLWCEGTGSCIASAGTATITGSAAASAGSHNTFTVTGAGTVTVTVTGSLTFFQLENSPYPTQRIDNAGAVGTSATRNKDVLDDQVSGNLTAAGSVAFQWTPSHNPSGTVALCGSYVDASNYTALLHDATKYIWRKRIGGVNYDAELTATFASGTTYDIALYFGANGINLAVDGTLGTPHANADPAQLGTRWQWGADGNGGQQAGAAFKEKYLWTRALSDSELQAVTL